MSITPRCLTHAQPISAMASVTKHLNFAVTTSTSYEQPYVVAKRFSTLDHLTGGRFGWNIVTSWKQAASRAVGLPYVDHDTRYDNADEYLRILYKYRLSLCYCESLY
jgi:alkanesulfonate monooxygenase SsuD/methylene tetrahydromethanopterin reductase-like flavin-dependent oxidoreductase (luciferase family)